MLIHCSLAHSGAWRGVAAALEDDLDMIAYDLPMHGRSGDWDGQGNVHDVATDMAMALLDQPMDLIGHSFGATVALRIAVEHPELVRSLMMIEPVYFAALHDDDPAMMKDYAEINAPFAAAIEARDMAAAARAFNGRWGAGDAWDNIPEATREYMTQRIHFVPASQAFLGDDSAGLLEPGRFERVTMPTVLLEGDQSPPMTDAINASLAKRIPHAKREVIKGAGHMSPLTHPVEVAGAIRVLLAAR
jgi:pimeloyl-ACP methyl ester carboxylesterase